MVNSKKLLSLFLAVVMTFSVLTVMASAYTVGPEVAGDINIKYTVEKVDKVPETADSLEYIADNIYAVSVWMQSDKAVEVLTAPVHYNKALFAPVLLYDGEMVYPGVDQDTNYTDAGGDASFYVYTEGDYLNNTGMYKADGTTATTTRNAVCIGLGNSNSDGVTIIAELVSPDHHLYGRWGAGLPADTGVVYVNLDVASKSKTAYLNTISGIEISKDWNKMFTFYFETLPGVTEDDIAGAEFGVFTDDCFTVDGATDESGKGYYATGAVHTNPNKNVVSNAVVEAAAADPLVYHVKNQIQWADKDAGTVNLGVVAGFDLADIAIDFDEKGTATNVSEVGAVVTINAVTNPYKERFVYEANDGASYYFRTVITNVPKNYDGDIVVTPYVVYGGQTYEANTITITAADLAGYVARLS